MFRHDQMLYNEANMQTEINGNNNTVENDMNIDINMNGGTSQQNVMGGCQQPINEGVRERCVHRTFVHEVPHVCPIHTRVVNHHVYRHTYRPAYTCSEENVVSNVQCGSCCQFR